jgi:glutamate-5-semialdehyde dehydrogenase
MSAGTEIPTRAVEPLARAARSAARVLASLPAAMRDRALHAMAGALERAAGEVLAANASDVAEADGKLPAALVSRLALDAEKLAGMAEGIRAVASLPDPVGRVLARTLLDDGLVLEKITCPLGVLAVVFEARPDAVTQIAALAVKSGNAVLLKGGREAARSSEAIVRALHAGLVEVPEVPGQAVTLLSGREEVDALLALDDLVDLVIPRGGNELVRAVKEKTRIPVLGHAEGICHVYVDASARAEMAIRIVLDAKLQYPAACNAAETVLVSSACAPALLPALLDALVSRGVEIRACSRTRELTGRDFPLAGERDYRTEYGGPTLNVKVVEGLDEAIAHVNTYGSGHTDAIVTEDLASAERFLAEVDSAGVYHNASTRFADGYRYGFGAEVGISTSRLHARGPVGLEGLVTHKYLLRGSGQVVASYSGREARAFRHERMD